MPNKDNQLDGVKDRLPKIRCVLHEPMSAHTSFRVGGPAELFFLPQSREELTQVLTFCKKEGIPSLILGNGSNLLVSDKGFPGAVIAMEALQKVERKGNIIYADAGVRLGILANEACKAALTGLEFAAGIPGTVGGALVMNAGAYGGEIKDVLKKARILTPEGNVEEWTPEELELSYRHSCIPEKDLVVLGAWFELKEGDSEEIRGQMQMLGRQRKEKQPLEYPSAGSTFKRPEGYFAGKLIQDAGLAGYRVGGAAVSAKHCGFVINEDHASAADIWELCRQVKERVEEQFGVTLELEVKTIGEFD